jgi:hypothetical protein
MADEAFALSPISARAALPGEEDYAAISEAFMETSRGRWFLTEYAKRNRNADTRMVLDAVARIEQSLAAQKEESLHREESLRREESLAAQQQAAAAAAAAAEDNLKAVLGAIRDAVEAAQESAVDSLALETRTAPVRKGARVLREIAWRLREIGNDGRICDLIDSQVAVIEQGAEQISSDEARAVIRAAFAEIEGRLAEFAGNGREPEPVAEAEAASPSPASPEMAETAVAGPAETAPVLQVSEAEVSLAAAELSSGEEAILAEADEAVAESSGDVAAAQDSHAHATHEQVITGQSATGDERAHDQDSHAEDTYAHDEALLDMVAMEMGAPDPVGEDEIAEMAAEQAHAQEPPRVQPEVLAAAPEPVDAPIAPAVLQEVETPAQAVVETGPAPAVQMSLGSSIIASGMLRRPASAANDPLAPIRRMSQAEKIAFFS